MQKFFIATKFPYYRYGHEEYNCGFLKLFHDLLILWQQIWWRGRILFVKTVVFQRRERNSYKFDDAFSLPSSGNPITSIIKLQ